MKRFALILALLPALFACAEKAADTPATDTRRTLARLDDHLTLGAPVTERNLTVWPVFTDQPLDLGEFLTLQEALEKQAAEVREVGGANSNANEPDNDAPFEGDNSNEVDNDDAQVEQVMEQETDEFEEPEAPEGQQRGQIRDMPFQGPNTNDAIGIGIGGGRGGRRGRSSATVNRLVIENKSDLPILICAGTVVKGGNQDRQIGQDFVVQAKTTVPVDAFCVEQGRWSGQRQSVATDGKFEVAKTNATIGVRSKGQYGKDQGEVWQEVEKVKKQVISKSGTEDLPVLLASSSYAVAVDENDKLSAEELAAVCAKVKEHFASFGSGAGAPVGFAYAVNGKPVNVRTFAHSRVFSKQFDAFLNTMATEALLEKQEKFDAPTAEQVVKLVEEIQNADETIARTAALNSNGIREGALGYHNSCYVPSRNGRQKAVLTKDWTAK